MENYYAFWAISPVTSPVAVRPVTMAEKSKKSRFDAVFREGHWATPDWLLTPD
jgi:hypothetical protein